MKKYIFILLFICISGAVYAQRKVVELKQNLLLNLKRTEC
jgi:hypothetical protein